MKTLASEERLRLLRFVCSFAWADLEVTQRERDFVGRLVCQLDLPADEVPLVEHWLTLPPDADQVDPQDIPENHRRLFLQAARATILADGAISDEEYDLYALFESMILGTDFVEPKDEGEEE